MPEREAPQPVFPDEPAAQPAPPVLPQEDEPAPAPAPEPEPAPSEEPAPEPKRGRFSRVVVTSTRADHPDQDELSPGHFAHDAGANVYLHCRESGGVDVHEGQPAGGELVVAVVGNYAGGLPGEVQQAVEELVRERAGEDVEVVYQL